MKRQKAYLVRFLLFFVGGFVLQFAGLWIGFRLDQGNAPAEASALPFVAPALLALWPSGFHSDHPLKGLVGGLVADAVLYAIILYALFALWRWLQSPPTTT